MTGPREHYRIRYPEQERPSLTIREVTLKVFDLSESGACLPRTDLFGEGQAPQNVLISFADGGEYYTTAVFVRESAQITAVRFVQLVPLGRILQEQRRLNGQFLQVDQTVLSM